MIGASGSEASQFIAQGVNEVASHRVHSEVWVQNHLQFNLEGVALRNVVYKPPWSGGAEPRPRRRPSV